MTTRIHWGLLSTARINAAIIPAILSSKRNQLVAVASRSSNSARLYARDWKIPLYFGSYEELLESPEVDVIYNPLPNHLHTEWTIRAAQAGKHVLCEKPITLTPEDVDAIAQAAEAGGVIVSEAFMYRHTSQTHKVRDLVASGILGEVRLMRGSFSFVLKRKEDYRWLPECGGGSLWDVGCYPVSYARAIIGTPPVEVQGWQILSPGGVDISFLGQMRFANGVRMQFDSSFQMCPYTYFEVRGSEASLIIPSPFRPKSRSKIFIRGGGKDYDFRFTVKELYRGEIEDMADAILGNKKPLISLAESRENIATLAALKKSAQEHTPVLL